MRTVVLFQGNQKLEELVEGLERPVRGIKWLIYLPEILVFCGRNYLVISFRPRFWLGRTRFVQI